MEWHSNLLLKVGGYLCNILASRFSTSVSLARMVALLRYRLQYQAYLGTKTMEVTKHFPTLYNLAWSDIEMDLQK